ncbi:MAG: alpha/beta hydrolase [Vicinamibacterales bacterium]
MIAGSFYEASRTPAPAVVLLHMLSRTRHDWDEVATRFAADGIACLAIDLRGHGESGLNPSGSNDDLLPMRLDVKAARIHLKTQPGILADRLGLAGASIGANLAILDGATDPAVKALALLSAGLEYRNLRPEGALRNYDKRPALLVASTEDAYAVRSILKFETMGGGLRQVQYYDGAGHGTVMLGRRPELVDLLVDWFKSRLL